jgi:hypothetical protein
VDNSIDPPDPADSARWATPAALVTVAWLAAAGALVWCLGAGPDPAGRVLFGVAAVVCTLAALYGTAARPRLVADRRGVRIRGLTRTAVGDWAHVDSVRVVVVKRFGRPVPSLELEVRDDGQPDAGPRLYVFGRLDLGDDPREVAETLRRLRSA